MRDFIPTIVFFLALLLSILYINNMAISIAIKETDKANENWERLYWMIIISILWSWFYYLVN